MRKALVSFLIFGLFALFFLLLGGVAKTGQERLSVGLVSLVPLVISAYLLNSLSPTRSFAVISATLAVMFGVTAPVGGCMVVIAGGFLAAFLVLIKKNSSGQSSLVKYWLGWLGQFLVGATFAAWLVHQII